MKAGTRLSCLALHLWAQARSLIDSLGHCLVSTVCPVVTPDEGFVLVEHTGSGRGDSPLRSTKPTPRN